eukprot:Skav219108  [mRNA]  locus=scaffold1574:250270:250858:- [translate_table: standard]
MDQTPARPRRASRCFLDETPGKVAKPIRKNLTEGSEATKDDLVKEGKGDPMTLMTPMTGDKSEAVEPEDRVVKLTLQGMDQQEPTFEMDGKTYRVLDMSALLQVGTLCSETETAETQGKEQKSTQRMSLAQFKRQQQRKRNLENSEVTRMEEF